jgi:hypothetical protein
VSLDIPRAKARLRVMAIVNVLAVLAAAVAAVGAFIYGVEWLSWLVVAALGVGFAAQIWFIAGLRRSGKGA